MSGFLRRGPGRECCIRTSECLNHLAFDFDGLAANDVVPGRRRDFFRNSRNKHGAGLEFVDDEPKGIPLLDGCR
ncbi:MAG: hypothetical protein Q9211_002926 [Gyalolechia sp. 1 TL-2023]